jgi:hypothetical protein
MGVSRGGDGRWVLAVLLGWAILLMLAPVALAAEGAGKISGTVTAAVSHEDLRGIEVIAYEAGSEFPAGVAFTDKDGEYTVEGLTSGSYKVEFSAGFESGLNYVTQYYQDASSLPAAKSVPVAQGETVSGIDAELQEGGKINGRVTEYTKSEDIVPLRNIEVTVYEASGRELPVGYAITAADGEYTVEGLASGSYKVEFSASEGNRNYVTQYYDDAPTLATATSVSVVQGKTTGGIVAELQAGGTIEGAVTDASTHAALSNVEVVALGAGDVVDGAALTNASGQYKVVGLATGSYVVEFASEHYITQYYNDQPSFASADAVEVVQNSATAAIDAALVPRAPVNVAAPVASGTPAAGQTLSCSTGSWTGSPAPTYSYAWLRDGVAIAGAVGSTYVVQAADVGNGLTCEVTATNKEGSAAAASNTLIVPVPLPPTPPVPAIKLSGTKIVVSKGAARVPIACARANCAGTVELTEQRIVVKSRRGRRTTSKRETLILGKGSYSLAAGRGATVVVHLTASGRSALTGSRHHELSAKVVVSVSGGKTVSASVVLSEAPLAKHKGKHK